jgi:hypothetical protein
MAFFNLRSRWHSSTSGNAHCATVALAPVVAGLVPPHPRTRRCWPRARARRARFSRLPTRPRLLLCTVGARSPLDAAAYPCEDVRRYYAGLDGLAGDELRKLAAVVSPHAALQYQDVGLLVACL